MTKQKPKVKAMSKTPTQITDKSLKSLKFRDYKKAPKPQTIYNNHKASYGYLRQEKLQNITDLELIKAWRNQRLANVFVRYPSLFDRTKITSLQAIVINQIGGEDYAMALSKVLDQRGILEIADNSFNLSFISQNIYS